jgi:uncharacterized protein YndB with AHSA1/START domain
MKTASDTTLVIERTFRAPVERVFGAFTDPEVLKRWYAPVDGWTVPVSEVDLRVGGGYLLHLQPPGGAPLEERGVYREIVPNERLVYTVMLQRADGSYQESTVVTITFEQRGDETSVHVMEEGYSSREVRDRHFGGWTHMVGTLERILAEEAE